MIGENITVSDGIIIAISAMAIVFGILIIIMVALVLFKHLAMFDVSHKKDEVVKAVTEKKFELDVNDEDMLVACLVATIEASNENGREFKVVNVKECEA